MITWEYEFVVLIVSYRILTALKDKIKPSVDIKIIRGPLIKRMQRIK